MSQGRNPARAQQQAPPQLRAECVFQNGKLWDILGSLFSFARLTSPTVIRLPKSHRRPPRGQSIYKYGGAALLGAEKRSARLKNPRQTSKTQIFSLFFVWRLRARALKSAERARVTRALIGAAYAAA